MNENIFKAVVIDTEAVECTSGRNPQIIIYVVPWDTFRDAPSKNFNWKEVAFQAKPPSSIPNNVGGAGEFSRPAVGQLCWVVQDEQVSFCQILTYTSFAPQSFMGIFGQVRLNDGDFCRKISSRPPLVELTRQRGTYEISSEPNIKFLIDAEDKEISILSDTYEKKVAGGFVKDELVPIVSSLACAHTEVYCKSPMDLGNDWGLAASDRLSYNMQSPYASPPYNNKVIIKAGHISLTDTHLYEIDTRQATAVSPYKNCFTSFKLGNQVDGTVISLYGEVLDNDPLSATYSLKFGGLSNLYELSVADKKQHELSEVLSLLDYTKKITLPQGTIDISYDSFGYNFNDSCTEGKINMVKGFVDNLLPLSFWLGNTEKSIEGLKNIIIFLLDFALNHQHVTSTGTSIMTTSVPGSGGTFVPIAPVKSAAEYQISLKFIEKFLITNSKLS